MCVADDVLPDGTVVKAGTNTGYSAYAMGRDPKIWGADCEVFRPERWEDVDQTRKDFQFVFPVRNQLNIHQNCMFFNQFLNFFE